MKYLKTYKLFENRNWKSMPQDIQDQAYRQLVSMDSINNVDELFAFYDYWLNVSEPSADYDPEKVKSRLESFYSTPPCADEEWFPMWTSDGDTVECIMRELSGLYADYSFRPGVITCHQCGNQFTQTNRHQSFCSSSCENEYDERWKL